MKAGGTRRGPHLRLVMAVPHVDPEAVRRTLQSVRHQRGSRWSLTVVAAENHLGGLRSLLKASTSFRDRPRIRLVAAGGPCAARDLLGIGIEAGRGQARAR